MSDFKTDKSPEKKSEGSGSGNKKLNRAQKRYERAVRESQRAQSRVPHSTRIVVERHFNEETGRASRRLTTSQVLKKRRRQTPLQKAVRKSFMEGRYFIHGKISENEQDNAGVEAAHKAEEAGEDVVRFVRVNRRDKTSKRKRELEKARYRERRAEGEYRFRKYMDDNPDVSEKMARKKIQKEQIKKQYARLFRKRAKETKQAAGTTTKATQKTIIIAKKLAEIARDHAIGIGALTGGGLFFMLITSMISSCGAMLGSGTTTIMAGAYQSMPIDIDAAEDSMKLKEMYLQNDINDTETVYPGYDEYVYDLGHIGHDPFTLINYLSAVYGIFTSWDVEADVQTLFDEMYSLTFTPSEETRTRIVTTTIPGDMPGEDIISTEEEEYTVSIMTVTLTVKPLEDIVNENLAGNDEALNLYQTYGVTRGALQRFWSPLNLDWGSRISCYYGYRVHPISGENQFHRGLDIAVPEGTELLSAMDGTVMYARYDDSYGNYIVITDENGYSIRYAHMSSLSVSEGQTVTHGDLVGYSGNTGGSTGPHLHLECTYGADYYNPIFYFMNGSG